MTNEKQMKSKAASVLETTVLRFFLLIALFGTAATSREGRSNPARPHHHRRRRKRLQRPKKPPKR